MSSSRLQDQSWDILIIGTGTAALTSALAASESFPPGSSSSSSRPRILLLDSAPATWVGGNGYFTAAAYRTVHAGLSDLLPLVSNVPAELRDKIEVPPYTAENFHEDLRRVTDGRSSPELGEVLVAESWETVKWLKETGGVEWWLSFRRQAYEVEGRWVFWGGLHLTVPEGGKGLVKALLEAVRRAGCEVRFETAARKILIDEAGEVAGVEVEVQGERVELHAKSVILCAGGFEANAALREKWMGPGWECAHTRGTPFNRGDMLLAAVEVGAKMVGDLSPSGCHSVAWDADSPKDGGDREKTNEFTKSGYPLGLMLNVNGQRFVDEGIDLRNYTYAKFGRAILEQPEATVFQVWDADGQRLLRSEEYRDEIVRKIEADSIEDLSGKLKLEGLRKPEDFVQTIAEYNQAVEDHRKEHSDLKFNPAIRDGLSTQSGNNGLSLAKSNWALPILNPPFVAIKVTSGITFTFAGLSIDPETAGVRREDGSEIQGLYCAGEMVGGLFYGNYPGGSGLTAGGVFGRRAGRSAAHRAAISDG